MRTAAPGALALRFLGVAQQDDADADEDGYEVDEELHGVPREVPVPERGLLDDYLGVEDHVPCGSGRDAQDTQKKTGTVNQTRMNK